MTKLPLLLVFTACVDAPATETVAKEGKIDPLVDPLVGEAGLKGEYLLRGQGLAGRGGGYWHVGLVGALAVSGETAVVTYFHPFSRIRTDGRLTRQEACVVTPASLPRFGEIRCTIDRDDDREVINFDYVTSADGNRAALEGYVQILRKTTLASGDIVYMDVDGSPMTVEATR